MELARRLAGEKPAPLAMASTWATVAYFTTQLDGLASKVLAAVLAGGMAAMATLMIRHRESAFGISGAHLAGIAAFGAVAVADGVVRVRGERLADWSLGIWSTPLGVYVLVGCWLDWQRLRLPGQVDPS